MMHIARFTFNPFAENTYVLYDETGECAIIDPGCYDDKEREELTAFIRDKSLIPVKLLNTHGHIDHAGGAAELIVKPGGGHPWLTIPQEVEVMAKWFDQHLAETNASPADPKASRPYLGYRESSQAPARSSGIRPASANSPPRR